MKTPSQNPEGAPPSQEKSDYELQRLKNIQRNNARLRALGLISKAEEAHSNAVAQGIALPAANSIDESVSSDTHSSTKSLISSSTVSSKKKRKVTPSTSPKRKSRRVKGLGPEGTAEIINDHDGTSDTTPSSGTITESRQERVQECRAMRQQIALRYAQMTDAEQKAAKENPTATYEHCIMRIRTMSDKQLRNRVKAIERASGKHCVVKMAIFKSCLQDQSLWELAEHAGAALERLKALLPPPEE